MRVVFWGETDQLLLVKNFEAIPNTLLVSEPELPPDRSGPSMPSSPLDCSDASAFCKLPDETCLLIAPMASEATRGSICRSVSELMPVC